MKRLSLEKMLKINLIGVSFFVLMLIYSPTNPRLTPIGTWLISWISACLIILIILLTYKILEEYYYDYRIDNL